MDECQELVHRLACGATVDELAAHFGRTQGAINARLALFVPPGVLANHDTAADWLRQRFESSGGVDGYDWLSVYKSRRMRGGAGRQQRGKNDAATTGAQVLTIWQYVVGAVLKPDTAQRFLAHEALPVLCLYDERQLLDAALRLFEREGTLLLQRWVRECAWDGGGGASLDWAELADRDNPDIGILAQELVTIAITSLSWRRHSEILIQRLGLDGGGTASLRAIGQRLDLSGERVRQLQERALRLLRVQHQPPRPSDHVRQIVREVIDQASTAGRRPEEVLLLLAGAAAPAAGVGLAVRVLAALAGYDASASRALATEALVLDAQYRVRLHDEALAPSFNRRANRQLISVLADTEWPEQFKPPPVPESIRPLREPDPGEHTGTLYSAKLDRDVYFESTAELEFVRRLEAADHVRWYCEQPVAIPYQYRGIDSTYYPDFLVVTTDGRCILVEIKNLLEQAFARNQAKTATARAYAAGCGWGYLATDGNRTMRTLMATRVEPAAVDEIDRLMQQTPVRWHQLTPVCRRYRINGMHIAALALQRRWEIHLNPYRLATRNCDID
jgi:Sigma-70, region 4